MTQRILVVDDDRQIVRLLSSYFEEAGFAALAAYDGESAKQMVCAERPDLVVMDIGLPGYNGLELTRWLRADPQLSSTPIILLTARVEAAEKIAALEIGADDYLTKPFNPREVLARVRAILRRTTIRATPPHMLQAGDLRLHIDQRLLSVRGAAVDLTPTEFSILQTLMENPEHAFTRTELIEKALGYTYEGMERTLDSHVRNLRKKIEVDPAEPCYLETVFGVGYRFKKSAS